ncbi:MAG TPA: DUF2625 domain-containing protein [Blastocatellia bacterium]|nr:DUF2625 domain-containing protein [Blastocatellia bacterium]
MRTIEELIDTDPAWPIVQDWLRTATNGAEVLPASESDRSDALVATQVTTRSPMGAIIYETGGILVDFGWIRILGSGHPRLPRTLPGWNAGRTTHGDEKSPPFLLVADDVIGGFFAIDGGGLGEARGNVYYFAPDALAWEDLGCGYSGFIRWCLAGDIARFYADYRWSTWEEDVAKLPGDQGYMIYPPLAARGPSIDERHRGSVPLAELYDLFVGKKEIE